MITSRIMVLTYDLLEDGHKDDVSTSNLFLFFYQILQMDSMLLYSSKPQDVT